MEYQATLESVRSHPLPEWFEDAKLGIFVHWGPSAVPAWAPLTGELNRVVAQKGWRYWFANNPYAEWYQNSMAVRGSPTQVYHQNRYGNDYPYERFVAAFEEINHRWDPDGWAALFSWIGARYVVLTAKHHDGYLLWPSWYPNPRRPRYQSSRDLVWEFSEAVRDHRMKFGVYYSGGLDWTFGGLPIRDLADVVLAIPQSREYASYVDQHWRELIERYEPHVLWNDIGYPAMASLPDLLAFYYNRIPEGVVNDRFNQINLGEKGSLRRSINQVVFRLLLRLMARRAGEGGLPAGSHWDFRTPEYTSFKTITFKKWEATRGLGYSFGYNQQESDEHLITVDQLVWLLVDVVSKNGNLLLNVGPTADGSIPPLQEERLAGLGDWLRLNGDAIFETRPWVVAEAQTREGVPVRFTQRGSTLYVILLGQPRGAKVTLEGLKAAKDSQAGLLGHALPLDWKQEGQALVIDLPEQLPRSAAYAIRIIPQPQWLGSGR